MKRLSMLALLICSRTTFAEPTAASGAAPATPTAEARAADALVSRDLVQPLAVRETKASRFSRARMPAQERRVRILDDHASKDAQGNGFVRFSIDARYGFHSAEAEAPWRLDTITGCAYLDRSQVFVKKGEIKTRSDGSPDVMRFKGLGEMQPEQLKEVALDPATRRLRRVTISDGLEADEMTSLLMGTRVEPRRLFLEENALDADVDI